VRPWPLPKLLATNRNALTVYGVLKFIAGEARRCSATRQRIADVCGLSLRTIGDAVGVLNEARWLAVNYGRQGMKTWYRFTFPVVGFFPVVRKTTHSKGKSMSKNDTQQIVSCMSKNDTQSLKGLVPAPPLPVGPAEHDGAEEHYSARIEREALARIRTRNAAPGGGGRGAVPISGGSVPQTVREGARKH